MIIIAWSNVSLDSESETFGVFSKQAMIAMMAMLLEHVNKQRFKVNKKNFYSINVNRTISHHRRDSTDARAAALYPADPGSNPVISMLQRAIHLSVSASRQTQLIMNRSWSRTFVAALLHWLDYKTLQLLLLALTT